MFTTRMVMTSTMNSGKVTYRTGQVGIWTEFSMDTTGRARSKRSPRENRRAAILEAAAQVFFEQGYAATSIDAIIERIGGSKRTIYNEFGSKEGVFTALVSESADAALAALSVERFAGRNLSE